LGYLEVGMPEKVYDVPAAWVERAFITEMIAAHEYLFA